MLKIPGQNHAGNKQLTFANPDRNRSRQRHAQEQRSQSEAVEPGEKAYIACDKSEVGQHDIAADQNRGEVKQGDQKQYGPGPVAQEVREVLPERSLLLRIGLDALFRREKGDHEEDDAEERKQAHGELIAQRVIAAAKELDHWDGEARDDEAGAVGGDLAVGRDAGTLVGVLSHNRRQRCVRHIVNGVDHAQKDVGGPGIDDLGARAEVRSGESEDANNAKRHRRPEQPWTEFAPPALGPVRNDAHHGIETRDAQPHDQEEGPCLRRGQTEGMGIEVQLQGQHGLKDKVGGHVAERIADLFANRKFLDHMRLVLPLRRYYPVTLSASFTRSSSRDELPIMIVKSPGSTSYFMFTL